MKASTKQHGRLCCLALKLTFSDDRLYHLSRGSIQQLRYPECGGDIGHQKDDPHEYIGDGRD